MADLDAILDTIPDRSCEDVSLEDIMNIPGMAKDTVLPYHLYLSYNPRLPECRKEKVRHIIERIRFNVDYINRRNLEYLERDFRTMTDPSGTEYSVEKIATEYKEES